MDEPMLFVDSNDRLFMKTRPYTGKYAVRSSDFFQKVSELQLSKMETDWKYRPLNSEIEITSCCNDSCLHCGMGANGMNGERFTSSELISFLDQIYDCGIVSYSITGGEPFLEFDNMVKMISHSAGRVDICKITSNGFWGKDAEGFFERMVAAGLLKNRFFVPCLMISIGEQSTKMEYVCKIFNYAARHFSSEELTLCISSLSEYGQASKVKCFVDIYKKIYGSFPKGRFFLTENYYRNSTSMCYPTKKIPDRYVSTYMSGPVRCFEQTIGKYVLPRIFVRSSGKVCTCACFNPPEQLYIGDIKKQTVREVLHDINANSIVRIIAEDGLHNFRHWIDIDWCKNTPCSNECEACSLLIRKL